MRIIGISGAGSYLTGAFGRDRELFLCHSGERELWERPVPFTTGQKPWTRNGRRAVGKRICIDPAVFGGAGGNLDDPGNRYP